MSFNIPLNGVRNSILQMMRPNISKPTVPGLLGPAQQFYLDNMLLNSSALLLFQMTIRGFDSDPESPAATWTP